MISGSPLRDMIGRPVSPTKTVLIFSTAALPAASDTVYFSWYSPTFFTSTFPVALTLDVRFPSTLSFAVTPNSWYAPPTSTLTVASPINVITGLVVSTTFTTLFTSTASFPDESLTVYVTVYSPILSVFTVLDTSILLLKSPSTLSAALAPISE